MLLAQIDPQVTVEQVSANRLVVVKDGKVIRTMDCIVSNDKVDEMVTWAREGERFQLVADETVKIGQPVNRADADYWIEQIRARALEQGEVVGRVKAN